MISAKIGHSLDPLILRLYRLIFRNRVISPNVLTVFGLFFSVVAFICIAVGDRLLLAAIFLLVSGFFDLLDGAVARQTNLVTPFGGFFDSVLDRYSDLIVMLGVAIHYLRIADDFFLIATFVAAIGVAIIPYARARAEAASIKCKNGLLERPERVILLVIGLMSGLLKPVVLILAVFTHVTVIQRILLARKELRR
ncbi:MAG: CDP-diacylglycerol--inositol 3-phosphatidyltransferase [Syntrophorhabdaceae bacterium PtaU1.Bin034]|nr:MAG: CDP-diacylglycerol--inositol 3-phosphatidyltransferase [Syntrophorhabdaceae bacterium PtaU1.Bin034]